MSLLTKFGSFLAKTYREVSTKFKTKHKTPLANLALMSISTQDQIKGENQCRLANVEREITDHFDVEPTPKSTFHGVFSDPKLTLIFKFIYNKLEGVAKKQLNSTIYSDLENRLKDAGINGLILQDATVVNVNSSEVAGCKTTIRRGRKNHDEEGASRDIPPRKDITIQVAFDLLKSCISTFNIIRCNAHERFFTNFKAGFLYIYDRGVGFKDYCKECCTRGAYYLVRVRKNCQFIILDAYDLQGNRLPELVGSIASKVARTHETFEAIVVDKKEDFEQAKIDYEYALANKQKLPVNITRFISFVFVDDENKRQNILTVTNISREQMPLSALVQFYRLRWIVELFFKTLKSCCGLKSIKSSIPNIVESLIYASLCNFQMKAILANAVAQYHLAGTKFDLANIAYAQGSVSLKEEISLDKFCKEVSLDELIKAILGEDKQGLQAHMKRLKCLKLFKKVLRETSEFVHKNKKPKATQLVVAIIIKELQTFFRLKARMYPDNLCQPQQNLITHTG